MHIRAESLQDRDAVHRINLAAFETSEEAEIVDKLRAEAHPIVSLIAEVGERIVGHILFSPVTIVGHPGLKVMGLGPMAVELDYQNEGIGSALVHAGIERCRGLGAGAIIVIGHPGYYPRFGFVVAEDLGLRIGMDVPREAFMCLELVKDYLRGIEAEARYHPAFDSDL